MRNQRVRALSISGPVFDVMGREGLTGRVFANHRRACNLMASGREIIALVGPAVGNGPLNIVIEDDGVFDQVKPGLPVAFSDHQLVLGDSLVVLLGGAQLWRPEVRWECLATQRNRLEDGFAVLRDWLFQDVTTQAVIASCPMSRPRHSSDKKPGQRRPSRSAATYRGQAGYAEIRSLGFDTLRYSTGVRSPTLAHDRLFLSSEVKQSPSHKEEIASSQKTLLAMTRAEQLPQDNVAKGLLGLSTSPSAPAGTRSPHNLAFLTRARVGIHRLLNALQDGDRPGIRESAALLAGLGPGLTPAGDDYLLGLMAGLRVWPGPLENGGLSPQEICQIIFEAAEGRTTLLSRAFLRGAKEGLFGENWHELLAALVKGKPVGIRRAARRILSSGATSGGDALAGFLSPYLSTTQDRVGQKPNQRGR